jgi:alditol oxidase
VHYPETVAQVQSIVRQERKLRVLGTRHSFNGIADSTESILSLERLTPSLEIDHARRKATVSGNLRYGDVGQALHAAGFALHNLGSLPHISIAGAFATGTHGSGSQNQNLAAAVSAVDIVTASGDLVSLSRAHDPEVFDGVVVSLGTLGVVVRLTLDLLPTFEISQTVYEGLPFAALDDHFDAIMGSGYSVSLFTDWQGEAVQQAWVKRSQRDNPPPSDDFYSATPATIPMHPIRGLSAESCTPQLGIVGPWHECLPHFRFDMIPSAGDELQSEYFVPRRHAAEAIRALRALHREIAPVVLVSEMRTIAADSLWLSPCYARDSVAFHFTWKPDWATVRQLLPQVEARLAPFEPRPHWGKLFTMPPERIQAQYEKLPLFRQLIARYDPQGKFRNPYVDSILSGR